MKLYVLAFLCVGWLNTVAQTDAYIKIHDSHQRHPRVLSVEFPGDTDFPADYDALYGHGAVLENPWLAVRVYMDARQSVDLYLKQSPRLELDHTGFYSTKEMVDSGYGCDVLWAGKSVALGSFRGYRDGMPVTIDSVASRSQSVVDSGSVMVVDKDWMFNGHPIQMTQTYRAVSDSRDIEVSIDLDGARPGDLFATGVQKLEFDNEGFILREGMAGSWGRNILDKAQPDWQETVGLGIWVSPENIVSVKEDELNYLFILRPDASGKIRYRITATGSREKGGFKSADSWFDYIKSGKPDCHR